MKQKIEEALKSTGDAHIKVTAVHEVLRMAEFVCNRHGPFHLAFVFIFGKVGRIGEHGKGAVPARRCPICESEGAAIPKENLEFVEIVKRARELGFSPAEEEGVPLGYGSRRWRCFGSPSHITKRSFLGLPESGCSECKKVEARESRRNNTYDMVSQHLEDMGGVMLTPRNVYLCESGKLKYRKPDGTEVSTLWQSILKLRAPGERLPRGPKSNSYDALQREAKELGFELLTPKSQCKNLAVRVSFKNLKSGLTQTMRASYFREMLLKTKIHQLWQDNKEISGPLARLPHA
jgi:hypothetical protein